ncbi:MAG: hypothetical protein ACRYFS_23920 [Janthinobacterium lividum]
MEQEAIKKSIEEQFVTLLTKAGTNRDTPDLFQPWLAFKAFAHTKFEHTHGGLLFECGHVNWGAGDFFEVSFLRFFYLDVEESWEDMMVRASFSFADVPELNQFKMSISADVDETSEPTPFVDEVEANQRLWLELQNNPIHHSDIFMGSQ